MLTSRAYGILIGSFLKNHGAHSQTYNSKSVSRDLFTVIVAGFVQLGLGILKAGLLSSFIHRLRRLSLACECFGGSALRVYRQSYSSERLSLRRSKAIGARHLPTQASTYPHQTSTYPQASTYLPTVNRIASSSARSMTSRYFSACC